MKEMILYSFLQAGPTEARRLGYGLSLVVGAISHTFSSALATVLAGLFLTDLMLGVLRAVHQRGAQSFDWDRFGRAWLKLAAAMVGVVVFTFGDVLLMDAGFPGQGNPLTSAALFGMCWGFFWSAIRNLGHFYPDVDKWIDKAMRRTDERAEESRRP